MTLNEGQIKTFAFRISQVVPSRDSEEQEQSQECLFLVYSQISVLFLELFLHYCSTIKSFSGVFC